MKKTVLLLFLTTICLELFAQTPPAIQWQKCYGGSINDEATSLALTNDGGYIVAGFTMSNDGDITGKKGADDFWVIKLNATGNIDWKKCLGGTSQDGAASVKQTKDGGYIVAGYSFSGDGDITNHHHWYDYWVVKLSAGGNILWDSSFGGQDSEMPTTILETTDGGFIVSGYSNSKDADVPDNHGGYDYWVVKMSALGIPAWSKSFGGSGDDYASSIQQTADGGYIIAGNSNSGDGDVNNPHGKYDGWVVKLTSAGSIDWSKTFGGSEDDNALAIIQTTDGGYLFAGLSNSSDGDLTTNKGHADYWIVKLTSTGGIVWQNALGGNADDYALCVDETNDGGYIVGGKSMSGNGDVSFNHGADDYWIVKLSPGGAMMWEKSYGGNGFEVAYAIEQTPDNGYIIAGSSKTLIGGDVTGNHGASDYWIVKLNYETGISEPGPGNDISIYPNPVSDFLHIDGKSATYFEIAGMDGRIYIQKTKGNSIDMRQFSAGMYLLNIYDAYQNVTGREKITKID